MSIQSEHPALRTLSPPLPPRHVISTCRSDSSTQDTTTTAQAHPPFSLELDTMTMPHYQQRQPEYSGPYHLHPEEQFTVEELEALAHSLTHANHSQFYEPDMDSNELGLWRQHSTGEPSHQEEPFDQGMKQLSQCPSGSAPATRVSIHQLRNQHTAQL